MQKPYFLGIDAGTTNIKASFMDLNFCLIDEEKQNVSVFAPFPGASEIDMNDYWERMCAVTRALKARNAHLWGELAGVGITGQGDGLWPIDENGFPVRHAMLWNDTRSKCMDFDGDALYDAAVRDYANIVYAGSVAALLKWMKIFEPENFRRIKWALHCKDWLNYKLTGRVHTDFTDASTSVFNVLTGEYSKEILDVLELSECRDILPDIVDSTAIIGPVTPEAAESTGICAGTPVAEGAVDVCTAALGNDIGSSGKACTIIGTTLGNEMVVEPENIDPKEKRGLLMRHIVPGTYIWIMPTLSGASTMDFVKSMLFPEVSYPALEEELERLPIGCGGLIYQPYIYGERAPFQNPFATGGFCGLTYGHTKLDLMRSVFEGLANSFYDCYRVFTQDFNILYLSGGASVSDMVCRMFCDVMGKEARRIETKETGALGIIRILQVALGYAGSFADFPEQKAKVFIPDMQRHEQYMAAFQLFAALRNSMEDFWSHREKSMKLFREV